MRLRASITSKSHRILHCGFKPILDHSYLLSQTVTAVVSYAQYYVISVGTKSTDSFSVNPIVVHVHLSIACHCSYSEKLTLG